ncbi:uncharacterized protein C8Q71DRAFT_308194 [Rhodofomes roseus]|uniref:C2H2-type domain-containing protein n=1 Tax=Rhodofomes roseus TaxID=34475 RepID=A0ABQ8K2W2_9APHY|nr:uncharacterized protein C8Q71DRAFT_308194 [Rhodofomes roseus]KAH9831169.1 hypothetical protein C8Q71DRAFT_308194 [Rhodofomes roseus]
MLKLFVAVYESMSQYCRIVLSCALSQSTMEMAPISVASMRPSCKDQSFCTRSPSVRGHAVRSIWSSSGTDDTYKLEVSPKFTTLLYLFRYSAGSSGSWNIGESSAYNASYAQHTAAPTNARPHIDAAIIEDDLPVPNFDVAGEPLYLARCEWGLCNIGLDDTSPSGIMRHLREWHFNSPERPFHKKRRDYCQWAGGCGKEMAHASFGKHVSYVHLRHSVQCPHCHRDIGRPGLLPLHIQRYCRRAPRDERDTR